MPTPFFERKCNSFKKLLCIPALFICIDSIAQLKWDGEAGDGLWSTPANWVGNIVPAATDDVVLDNSIVTVNYTVSLPGSSFTTTVKTIAITPAAGNVIQFIIPATNNAVPAFTATGAGYGIIINNGGSFLNSNGSSSGASVVVNDSIKINNGGQYTHNTRSSHAALVSSLSKITGTEKGVFKFDVPGGGYTIASTGRTYGNLVLSADASAGSQAYSTSAAMPLIVNGNLVINTGVTLNLDLTSATTIKGNYIQNGGVFNLASQPNSNTVYVQGDFIQTAGIITETSSGLPAIELNGSNGQQVSVNGIIINSIDFKINNIGGVSLMTGLLLPYHLNLIKGIVNTNSFLITLQADCTITADSLSNNSFINGPLRKEGLSATDHFLFPVGKAITQRWLELKNVTGNYTVEFFKANPNTIATVVGAGIHHTSSIEYWTVEADATPMPGASVELSFDNVNSGGVTDMATLRVAQLESGAWINKGNSSTSGTAGSSGSVVSNPVNTFDPSVNYFTLASSDAFQNPLPLKLLSFNGKLSGNDCIVSWAVATSLRPAYFELQSSVNGVKFDFISKINALPDRSDYSYSDQRKLIDTRYYRLKVTEVDGSFLYSQILQLAGNGNARPVIQLWPSVVKNNASLVIASNTNGNATITIHDINGRIIYRLDQFVQKGDNNIPLFLQSMAAGVYVIVLKQNDRVSSVRFIKTGR